MREKKLRVLIVDDEPAARFTVTRMLEKIEFCTIVGEAENGSKALDLIASTTPDVVLADVSMPGMNGIELAERIGDLYPKTKVIMLTMHSSFDYAVNAFRLGAVDYVLKDAYDIAPLRAALEKAGNELDAQRVNEMMNLEKELREQIENKTYIGKTGRFVRFHSQADEYLTLADRYYRLNGNAFPVSEDIWFLIDEIDVNNALTYIDGTVTADEDTLNAFILADGEHFYFPAIYRLSGLIYGGTFTDTEKQRIAAWYENFIGGNMETFPGDFAALCIEKRINPEAAKQTLTDCVQALTGASSRLVAQIKDARSIHEIEIILKAALLTEQLSVVKTNRVVEDVKKYIDEHLSQELTLKTLADVVELSPAYLSTYFKQETGTGLKQYIQTTRLKMAARLLKTTNMKIYLIAEKCGFVNVRYFSQYFTQYYGITPQKYRIKGLVNG